MGIRRAKEDPYVREMAKWEMRPVEIGDTLIQPLPVSEGGRGGAPFQEYPKWVYKPGIVDGVPAISASKIVNDEPAELIAKGQGWYVDQAEAVKAIHTEYGKLAAHRAYEDRNMSESARAEAAKVDEASMAHLPVIPETPIRKAGAKS